jgi:pimeloyl-ACP methyl ester carboxylesterase/aryl carrier-like protein
MTISTVPSVDVDRTRQYEARLSQLWERNLGVAASPADDYFRSGGDSLRATQLLGWIRQSFGVELSLLDVFEARTIEAQARLLLDRAAAGERAEAAAEYRFFGRGSDRLFGVLHRPAARGGRVGVALCYPMGQEYMRIHRTYVELARSLARSGFHVLRFDYYGCGDSAGDTTAGTLERWTHDIHAAVAELSDQAPVTDVYLVGSRIGANLVLNAHAARSDVAGIVLWEPIVSGPDYLSTLRRANRDLLDSNARLDGYETRQRPGAVAEFLGYPITRSLFDEVEAINLLNADVRPQRPTLVVANAEKPALGAYVQTLTAAGCRPDYVVTNEPDGIWLKEDRQNKGVVPVRAVQSIVSWISGRAA